MDNLLIFILFITLILLIAICLLSINFTSTGSIIYGGSTVKKINGIRVLIWDIENSYSAVEIYDAVAGVDVDVVILQNCIPGSPVYTRFESEYTHMTKYMDNVLFTNLNIEDQVECRTTINGISIYNIGTEYIQEDALGLITKYDKGIKLFADKTIKCDKKYIKSEIRIDNVQKPGVIIKIKLK